MEEDAPPEDWPPVEEENTRRLSRLPRKRKTRIMSLMLREEKLRRLSRLPSKTKTQTMSQQLKTSL